MARYYLTPEQLNLVPVKDRTAEEVAAHIDELCHQMCDIAELEAKVTELAGYCEDADLAPLTKRLQQMREAAVAVKEPAGA